MLADTVVMGMIQVDLAMTEDILTKVMAMVLLMIPMAPMIAMDTVAMVEAEVVVVVTVAVKR